MSYGWLAESALLPKKSKPIKVDDDGSCFALKAVIQREKPKRDQSSTNAKKPEIKMKRDYNAGI